MLWYWHMMGKTVEFSDLALGIRFSKLGFASNLVSILERYRPKNKCVQPCSSALRIFTTFDSSRAFNVELEAE